MMKTFLSISSGLFLFLENLFINIFIAEVLLMRPGLSFCQCLDHCIMSLLGELEVPRMTSF